MCKQPVLAFYCSRPLIYEGLHIGFQFHEGNSEFNSEERNSDSNSNSNDGNSIQIPPGLGKANSNSIPELDLELARKSNSGAELTPTLYPNHDCSALMKWPNSNKFANCSHTTHSVHIESG